MKNIIIITALMLGSMTVVAQRSDQLRNGKVQRVEQNKQLNQKLNLTNTQELKVNEIRQETKQKVNVIRNDRSLTEEQKKTKLRTVVKEGQLKKVEVLTPGQQKIMSKEMKSRRR